MTKARDIASAIPAPSTVSSAELGYLDGVTSAIQTQIDSKIGSASAINPTIVDAKGDIIAASAADTPARLAVGANGTVLTAASGQATGLEWATVAAGANWTLLNSGGTALTGAATVTVSGISGKDKIMILVKDASSDTVDAFIRVRFNTDTGANYDYNGFAQDWGATYSFGNNFQINETGDSMFPLGQQGDTFASRVVNGYLIASGCNASGKKIVQFVGTGNGSGLRLYNCGGVYNSSSTISSISINADVGNLDAGSVYVYTSA